MTENAPNYRSLIFLMRAGLVAALVAAGWIVYRNIPEANVSPAQVATQTKPRTQLHIAVRLDTNEANNAKRSRRASLAGTTVELYSIDTIALREEFIRKSIAERRVDLRFDEFLKQRMSARPPISAKFDEQGRATVHVPPGRWWVHATINEAGKTPELSWRLPVNIAGREQQIELTSGNAYVRARSF